MGAVSSPINIFIVSYGILLSIAIITPYLNTAFGEPVTTFDMTFTYTNDLPAWLGAITTMGSLILNLVLVIFWQFGLPLFWNIILYIPRTLVLISLYYIVFPTK